LARLDVQECHLVDAVLSLYFRSLFHLRGDQRRAGIVREIVVRLYVALLAAQLSSVVNHDPSAVAEPQIERAITPVRVIVDPRLRNGLTYGRPHCRGSLVIAAQHAEAFNVTHRSRSCRWGM